LEKIRHFASLNSMNTNLQNRFYQLYFAMTFEWTAHRFSGGALAFDLVNTVVCRNQPAKRIDRLGDPEAVGAFAQAATKFWAAETGAPVIVGPETKSGHRDLVSLREAIDGYFRPLIGGETTSKGGLSTLFAAAAIASDSRKGTGNLGALAAISAMSLLTVVKTGRAKVCPNCDWLFLDKSKNQSRLWCDMAVCGNRNKARLHYAKHLTTEGGISHE
jgi:predicted RNA-binding Zn ribbon-like protein